MQDYLIYYRVWRAGIYTGIMQPQDVCSICVHYIQCVKINLHLVRMILMWQYNSIHVQVVLSFQMARSNNVRGSTISCMQYLRTLHIVVVKLPHTCDIYTTRCAHKHRLYFLYFFFFYCARSHLIEVPDQIQKKSLRSVF